MGLRLRPPRGRPATPRTDRAHLTRPGARLHHRPGRNLTTGLLAAIAVGGLAWGVTSRADVGSVEVWVFRRANALPSVVWWTTWPVMQLGTIGAPALVAVGAAVAWRRWRPPVAVLASGYGAWALAQVVKTAVVRDRPAALLADVTLRESARGLGFVSGHAAIATGMAVALWPYLGTRGRVVVGGLTAGVGLGRMVGGAHLPLDVLGGAFVGVVAGMAVHAAIGVPRE